MSPNQLATQMVKRTLPNALDIRLITLRYLSTCHGETTITSLFVNFLTHLTIKRSQRSLTDNDAIMRDRVLGVSSEWRGCYNVRRKNEIKLK